VMTRASGRASLYCAHVQGIPTMRRSLLLLPFCLAAATLAGCGNQGPLVYPPTRPVSADTAPAKPLSAPAPAASSGMPELMHP
jgi:predicted small lipoprotein YifL